MRRVTIIEFSPQNEDDTMEAIEIALEENALLKPSVNLIRTDCLELLTRNKFYFYKDWEYGDLFRRKENK